MPLLLKQFRHKHRMSRERLADLLGYSLSTLTRREQAESRGKELPVLEKLALEELERSMSHRQDLIA